VAEDRAESAFRYGVGMIFQTPKSLQARQANQLAAIQVTALYEDLEAGVRAKALMDCVQSGLDVPAQCKLDLWRFDWLGERSMGNMALSMARSSMLVLVSASTDNPASPELERWINAWMQSREDQLSALVLLAQDESRHWRRHPLQDCLQRAAAQKGVEFFSEFFKSSSSERETIPAYHAGQDEMFGSPLTPNVGWSQRDGISPVLLKGARAPASGRVASIGR
jgi:hypothetical protein